MCTIIVLNDVHERYPLIIAANRDEHIRRPSLPPKSTWKNQTDTIYPIDQLTGGSWIGSTSFGRIVALTNQDDGKTDMNMRSRGEVVKACLEAYDEGDVSGIVKSIRCREYNPFNLLYGCVHDLKLALVHHTTEYPVIVPVEKGVTVVSNDMSPTNKYARKTNAAYVAGLGIDRFDYSANIITRLRGALSTHDGGDDPYQSLCVHAEEDEWETRSTSIMLYENDGSLTYLHNEGSPCRSNKFSHQIVKTRLDLRELLSKHLLTY